MKYGQLGVATIAPICKLIAYAVSCAHPPYAVLPVIFVFSGFGNGLLDAGWNAWIGNMENPNQLLGFLHGSYGLGATISPLLATALVTKANQPWYTFYYIMVSSHAYPKPSIQTLNWLFQIINQILHDLTACYCSALAIY